MDALTTFVAAINLLLTFPLKLFLLWVQLWVCNGVHKLKDVKYYGLILR